MSIQSIISIIISLFIGLMVQMNTIAPMMEQATVGAAEAAKPIRVNAKKSIALKAAIAAVEHDHALIDKCFNKATGGTGGFGINNDLTLSIHHIDKDLDDIKSMVKACNYDQAEAALKEYKQLLARQVTYCTGWFPFGHMFIIIQEAYNLGIQDYWKSDKESEEDK